MKRKNIVWLAIKECSISLCAFVAIMIIVPIAIQLLAKKDITFGAALYGTFSYYADGLSNKNMILYESNDGVYMLLAIAKVLFYTGATGLITSALIKVFRIQQKERKLREVSNSIVKAFRRTHSSTFNSYLRTHPTICNGPCYFAPRKMSVMKLEAKGLTHEDIIEAVGKREDLRLRTMASARSIEEHPLDRLIIEHFPKNTPYGCKIDRNSNITIVSTSSYAELGTGWFSYYLAKFGGFNYISKELEVDLYNTDSFYNISELSTNITEMNKKEKKLYIEKKERRNQFFSDIKELSRENKSWYITILSQVKNQSNTIDFHFSHCQENRINPVVNNMNAYRNLLQNFENIMKNGFSLSTDKCSSRYPLLPENIAYVIRKEKPDTNWFSLRISSEILTSDSRAHIIMCKIAEIINKFLYGGKGGKISLIDEEDFKKKGEAYAEINKDNN